MTQQDIEQLAEGLTAGGGVAVLSLPGLQTVVKINIAASHRGMVRELMNSTIALREAVEHTLREIARDNTRCPDPNELIRLFWEDVLNAKAETQTKSTSTRGGLS